MAAERSIINHRHVIINRCVTGLDCAYGPAILSHPLPFRNEEMKIALAQINPTVGDFSGNARKIAESAARARRMGAELAVFPELAIMGYPPRDLVEHDGFVNAGLEEIRRLAQSIELPSVVGFVARNETGRGKPLHNSAALLSEGRIASVHHKSLLPTYDVFDEDRYFEPGAEPRVTEFNGWKLGVTVCEDMWRAADGLTFRYHADPVAALAGQGAQVFINLSASPFTLGKVETRRRLLQQIAQERKTPLVYVNQVGGNDELVFDGGSMVVDSHGEVAAQAGQFVEDLLVVDLAALPGPVRTPLANETESALNALVLGMRDYLHKCGYGAAVIGLSGGIDSAVTAAIAVRALGPENVLGVAMPSRFSSQHSLEDAEALAENLGIRLMKIPIEPAHTAFLQMLAPAFARSDPGTAEENIQARCRGVVLMALANKLGRIVLATGNKSELASGYCTLYGDMCGGLAPLSDVPKGMVYALGRRLNDEREIIPQHTMTKAPSAELKPNQYDQDTLPPYDDLDRVLHAYIQERKDLDAIAASGIDRAVAADVIRRIEVSEYKRRQAVPGLKITSKAFGYVRRVPIAKAIPRLER